MIQVAPHAGAWIETSRDLSALSPDSVAPHAGAWIETFDKYRHSQELPRRAPRGRVD